MNTRSKPTFEEKYVLAKNAKVGDIWLNNKTGRTVEVISNTFFRVHLKHELGSVTKKQHYYFAVDYSPKLKI